MKLPFKIIIILTFIYTIYIVSNNIYKTNYNLGTNQIEGIIDYINIKDDKITLEIKAKDKVLVNLYKIDNFNFELGDKVRINGILRVPTNNTNFNLFNYNHYLKSKKIYYIMTGNKIELIKKNSNILYKIKNFITNRINNYNNSEYLKMFILGDTKDLDKNIYNTYKENGITHLFAISGMHISLLSTILLKLFKSYKITIIFLLLYLFLARFTPSVLRATFLFIILYFNKKFNLKLKSYEVLILIFCIMLLFNPYYIYNVGFIFSFLISFNLMIFSKYLQNLKYFKSLFYTSIISFISGLPIMINNYFSVNILSILLNMFFVPFISIIIFPFSLLTFIFKFLTPIYSFLIYILENISSFFSKINIFEFTFSSINIYILILYLILGFISLKQFFNKKYYLVILYIIILIIHTNINYFNKSIYLTFLDIGQGDSLLFKIEDKSILIDTGGKYDYDLSSNTIIPYLKSMGIKKLDYLILSHGDYDHMGEAINLVNNFKIEKVIFNCGPYNNLEKGLIKVLDKKKIKYYSCIKELNIDNNKLYFLQTREYDNENDNSNVIYTELNGYKFMFMGDAGIEKEKDILDKYNISGVDVLKVGHHGSKTSSSKEFINGIIPKYSIISVGKNNKYGHPNKEALNNLNNSKIYRTDQDGSILFQIQKNKLKIETCSP